LEVEKKSTTLYSPEKGTRKGPEELKALFSVSPQFSASFSGPNENQRRIDEKNLEGDK